ncbi:hypothetical protein DM01DRAFT_1379678 [Hesseltinella vesiculosa]|uniref:Orn/DAP/Arg decarboxylase 2 N-terminal domain-containing protein n=1 Tax=Hesseltinella vesiculosa TaxID=101127 RepID=A0A1X2GYI5_9FUNG|nr:hypothetical protein DM01DRAFT_1379678 [Hesseltinella vesiculosa]
MIPELETAILNPTWPTAGLTKETQPHDAPVYHLAIKDVIQQELSSHSHQKWEMDQENAFFVGDLGEVLRQHRRWSQLLPRIEPHFAVKANPDPMVLKLLASLNLGFDCASKAEIQQILDLGVEPQRIIYANPCKQSSFIRYASQQNVAKMTFDNAEELYKIKQLYPEAELVLRILADDSKSVCQLGLKFGAPLDTVPHLLKTAKDLDLNIVGVSFHVGSGCLDEYAFEDAVMRARHVFDQADAFGFHFSLLDVGGGFPGADVTHGTTFDKIAAVLGPAVDRHFPAHIRVIAEPGRFYVASAFTVCTNVIGRRTILTSDDQQSASYMYYVNDGMYGSFNCIMFDHQQVQPRVLVKGNDFCFGRSFQDQPVFASTVFGPTCDSIDCLVKEAPLPLLEEGDWLYWENMGAYTICAASQFNGFKKSNVVYTNTF